jgi:hypothetical protein
MRMRTAIELPSGAVAPEADDLIGDPCHGARVPLIRAEVPGLGELGAPYPKPFSKKLVV